MASCTFAGSPAPQHPSPQFSDGKFRNPVPMFKQSPAQLARLAWTFMMGKNKDTVPSGAIPVQALTRAQLLAAPDNTLFRLGHSTLLLKLDNAFYLTDPVFSKRASPVQWAGPARFHQPPISIEELPPLKAVILSHDHYDHLDHAAVLALAAKTEHFLAPLGVGDRLVAWGIDAAKVTQLDWWQERKVGNVRLIATPAQHFSGRSLSDGNSTLWASWVFVHKDLRVFFSGDTGYFAGFKAIGDKFGPFDVAMLETGAYDKQWPDVHMEPEQTLQAFLDLKGKWLMPVHNGTFDLSLHPWHEPFDRIAALASARGVPLATPEMGQALDLSNPAPGQAWWKRVDPTPG
ncbi:MBL fold metallo-hydrolase [Massilia violaceinigra]|uniref:MBL fold metallo-hydrolase n=1 Tax=Massilia violaceinigra TaxID=2045208 RepID=A0ABY4AEP1_9BURK|nr:MBL fold metallo-hydrolase [Massilia violaceinigra]UOD32394.1 MBL fold metallo-hydrolase [Massilia violaceinigra]